MSFRSNDEIADLIEKGLKTKGVTEAYSFYLVSGLKREETIYACALGMAYIGLIGDAFEAERRYWDAKRVHPGRELPGLYTLRDLLNISNEMAEEISYKHNFSFPSKAVAEWLREDPS